MKMFPDRGEGRELVVRSATAVCSSGLTSTRDVSGAVWPSALLINILLRRLQRPGLV